MKFHIRTFRNTDVEPICQVWNKHYASLGPACFIDPLRLELCCLAKPYFVESDLLVAENGDEILGIVHVGHGPMPDLSDVDCRTLSIAALCVVPGEEEDAVAARLLAEVDRLSRARGIASYTFRPMLPHNSFYLGSGVGGSLIGTTADETRVCKWLSQAGFQPELPSNAWELDLVAFNPPMDRQQIQIRRTAQVNREVDEPMLPWWQACMLGHTEPTAFQLTHRAEKRVLTDALFWTVASELKSTPEAVVWLWPPENAANVPQDVDRLIFLLAESFRQFQFDRLDVVRTFSAANDTANNAILRRLGFSATCSGMVFRKTNLGTEEK